MSKIICHKLIFFFIKAKSLEILDAMKGKIIKTKNK